MKILQLCNKPPYPPVDGGSLAMDSLTQGLLQQGHEVRVLAVCSDKHPVGRVDEVYCQHTRFEAVHLDLAVHPLAAAVALLCGQSYHVKRFESEAFAEKVAAILQEEEFDVVQLETVYLTPYVPVIRRYSRARIVLRAHNVEHRIWQQVAKTTRNPLKRWYVKHLALTLRAYELEHINDYDGVVCITSHDADFFRSAGCRRPLTAIPFGVPTTPIDNVTPEPDTLFHIGSMDWMPNQDGVRWFLSEVWPLVHRELPQLRLYLAGRKMPADLMSLQQEGVTVVGEVQDAGYFMASKQINIVPLLSGSGIRVKIIEAMAMGKAVVTTTVGAMGIDYVDGEHLLLADTPQDFVRQLRRLVDDPMLVRQLGDNAQQLIIDCYSQQSLAAQLTTFYCSLQDDNG